MRMQSYDRTIELLDVANNASFLRNFYKDAGSGLFVPVTHCNSYAVCFYAVYGVFIPAELSANDLYQWFLGNSPRRPTALEAGWRGPIEAATAAGTLAMDGHVVAVGHEPGHGHIAPVVDADIYGLKVSAAGGSNLPKAPIKESFGNLSYLLFTNNN